MNDCVLHVVRYMHEMPCMHVHACMYGCACMHVNCMRIGHLGIIVVIIIVSSNFRCHYRCLCRRHHNYIRSYAVSRARHAYVWQGNTTNRVQFSLRHREGG